MNAAADPLIYQHPGDDYYYVQTAKSLYEVDETSWLEVLDEDEQPADNGYRTAILDGANQIKTRQCPYGVLAMIAKLMVREET